MEQVISAKELYALDGQQDLVLLDCSVGSNPEGKGRSRYESGQRLFEESHIPNAQHADLVMALCDPRSPHIFALPDPEGFRAAMQCLGVHDGARVVLYDRSFTAWAARVWWMLRWIGFDNAFILDGGFEAWRTAGLPLSQGASTAPREGELSLHLRPETMADQTDVRGAVGKADTCLIDTLPVENFLGQTNDYARPGHIAGAKNLSALSMFDEAGCFKSTAALKAMYNGDRVERQVTYCGAGILAAATAFVMIQLGYRDVALYSASLQEWAADPNNPMEVSPE